MSDPDSSPFPAVTPARRVVIVLGMHRSGTSLVAGCLQRLGVDFGPRLMPPNADNPRGYFEHKDVVNLHDLLLLALNRSWDDTSAFPEGWWDDERLDPYRTQLLALLRRDFPGTPLWGLKDPRLCLLLPWWEPVWTEMGSRPLFILVRRAPAEVAASLDRRERMSAVKASLLWLRHLLDAERWSRGYERIFVDFHDFAADENAALELICRALGLSGGEAAGSARMVDPALGRSVAEADAPSLPPWVAEADAALRLGLAGRETDMRLVLDSVSRQLHACEPFLAQAAAARDGDLLLQLEAVRRQARWYEEEWRKAQGRVEKLQIRLGKKL